jgi:rubrerythrin
MLLSAKETEVVKELQTQEKSCIEKYKKYSQEAKDPELKQLFEKIHKEEQKHYDSLGDLLSGKVPSCNCNDTEGKDYQPAATYRGESEDKKNDCFLATDCIGTEKMVSTEYNMDIFRFGNPDVRKLLADIQIEEQNHAEMLYKYKMANAMA